jgi:hypothetical protein
MTWRFDLVSEGRSLPCGQASSWGEGARPSPAGSGQARSRCAQGTPSPLTRLLRNDGFRAARRGDGVGVAVYKSPHTVLGSEDTRDSETDRDRVVTATDLGPVALDFHDARKRFRDVASDEIEAKDLAVSIASRGIGHGLDNAFAAAREWSERIAEAHILRLGEQGNEATGVAVHDLPQGYVTQFDGALKALGGRVHIRTVGQR